jgi:hypothetical protein
MNSHLFESLVLVTLAIMSARADEPGSTKNTLSLAPGTTPAKAKIEDVAWIAGHWKGAARGGVTEEDWSGPTSGSMMASCRLIRDGKVVFYELAAIVEESSSLTLRLKHFNPDLTGWEEKSEVLAFPLVKLTSDAAYFNGVTFRKVAGGNIEIFVRIRSKDGKTSEQHFPFEPAGVWDRKSANKG